MEWPQRNARNVFAPSFVPMASTSTNHNHNGFSGQNNMKQYLPNLNANNHPHHNFPSKMFTSDDHGDPSPLNSTMANSKQYNNASQQRQYNNPSTQYNKGYHQNNHHHHQNSMGSNFVYDLGSTGSDNTSSSSDSNALRENVFRNHHHHNQQHAIVRANNMADQSYHSNIKSVDFLASKFQDAHISPLDSFKYSLEPQLLGIIRKTGVQENNKSMFIPVVSDRFPEHVYIYRFSQFEPVVWKQCIARYV